MPLDSFLQVNDVGIALTITITQNDGKTPIDLSAATSLTIYVTKPDGTLLTNVASLVNTGTDGKIKYITGANDLNLRGYYKIQASYMFSGNIKHSEKGEFLVESNLCGVN